jgi:hypothetical protein
MQSKCEVGEKQGAKEILRQNLRSFKLRGCGSRQWGGVAQEFSPLL